MDRQQATNLILGTLIETCYTIVENGPQEIEDTTFDLAQLVMEIHELVENQKYPIPTDWSLYGPE
jgi:hypothetical protein